MIIETTDRFDFVVTGASGNIGRHLIPILAERGCRILAMGRNAAALQTLFASVAGVEVADYDGLRSNVTCDTLIHLVVHNNDCNGSIKEFNDVNVHFAARMCAQFVLMKGRRFINIASIHSLDETDLSNYAVSKRSGTREIYELIGNKLDNVHIGYFYTRRYFGERFFFLNRHGRLGTAMFGLIKILKPTTSAQSLAEYVSDTTETLTAPCILTDELWRSRVYRGFTRTLDIIVACVILLFLFPALIAIWALIRIDSSGPAIFAQTRVGQNQEPFTLYKFRTMKRDTVDAGTHEISASAITGIGRFLRRTKLDELPQAINLLFGQMTLVGPRPCLQLQKELVSARQALDVFAIKPGVTGYAQIRKIDMSRPHDLAYSDYTYMKLQSVVLNLKILVLTALGRGMGDRVASLETT